MEKKSGLLAALFLFILLSRQGIAYGQLSKFDSDLHQKLTGLFALTDRSPRNGYISLDEFISIVLDKDFNGDNSISRQEWISIDTGTLLFDVATANRIFEVFDADKNDAVTLPDVITTFNTADSAVSVPIGIGCQNPNKVNPYFSDMLTVKGINCFESYYETNENQVTSLWEQQQWRPIISLNHAQTTIEGSFSSTKEETEESLRSNSSSPSFKLQHQYRTRRLLNNLPNFAGFVQQRTQKSHRLRQDSDLDLCFNKLINQ